MVQAKLLEEGLGVLFGKLLEFVHVLFEPSAATSHAETLLDPVLHVVIEDHGVFFEILTAQVVQEELLAKLRSLARVLPYLVLLEQKECWILDAGVTPFKHLAGLPFELAVQDCDLELLVGYSCQLDELSLELQVVFSAAQDQRHDQRPVLNQVLRQVLLKLLLDHHIDVLRVGLDDVVNCRQLGSLVSFHFVLQVVVLTIRADCRHDRRQDGEKRS